MTITSKSAVAAAQSGFCIRLPDAFDTLSGKRFRNCPGRQRIVFDQQRSQSMRLFQLQASLSLTAARNIPPVIFAVICLVRDEIGMARQALLMRAKQGEPGRSPRAVHSTSNRPAAPMPPPTHIVTTTYFAPRRLPSIRACMVQRAPVMP